MDGDEDKFTVIPLPASPRISLGKRNHATAAHATVLVALFRTKPFILLYQVDDDDVFHYLNVLQLISLILTGIHKICVVCFFVDRGWLLFHRMLFCLAVECEIILTLGGR